MRKTPNSKIERISNELHLQITDIKTRFGLRTTTEASRVLSKMFTRKTKDDEIFRF